VAVGKKAHLFDKAHRIPRINLILASDAAGDRSRLARWHIHRSQLHRKRGGSRSRRPHWNPAIVTGALFLAALFVAPLFGAIPAAATAPALILVGSMMVSVVTEIDLQEPEIAIPAFLTIMAIPLSFSIPNGLAFGFTAYALIRLLRGKSREVNWFVYVLAGLFVLRFYPSVGGIISTFLPFFIRTVPKSLRSSVNTVWILSRFARWRTAASAS
jgi:adenine/guanine/hypoxanthine permease